MLERISTAAVDIAHFIAAGLAPFTVAAESACEHWLRDPLSHPALDAMSPAELADLPPAALRSNYRE